MRTTCYPTTLLACREKATIVARYDDLIDSNSQAAIELRYVIVTRTDETEIGTPFTTSNNEEGLQREERRPQQDVKSTILKTNQWSHLDSY